MRPIMPNCVPIPLPDSNGYGPRRIEARPTPEQRAFLALLVIPRGRSEPQLGLPGHHLRAFGGYGAHARGLDGTCGCAHSGRRVLLRLPCPSDSHSGRPMRHERSGAICFDVVAHVRRCGNAFSSSGVS